MSDCEVDQMNEFMSQPHKEEVVSDVDKLIEDIVMADGCAEKIEGELVTRTLNTFKSQQKQIKELKKEVNTWKKVTKKLANMLNVLSARKPLSPPESRS